jgi:hypothetical protein
MRDRVRIRDLEPALLQIVAVIQERPTHKKRAFGIDYDANIRRLDQDVPIRRPVYEIHLVLQPRATPADHRHSQRARRASLFLEKRIQFPGRVLRDLDESLIADLVVDRRSRIRRVGHTTSVLSAALPASRASRNGRFETADPELSTVVEQRGAHWNYERRASHRGRQRSVNWAGRMDTITAVNRDGDYIGRSLVASSELVQFLSFNVNLCTSGYLAKGAPVSFPPFDINDEGIVVGYDNTGMIIRATDGS